MILEKLKQYIKDNGYKQQKIAEKLGVTPQHLSNVIAKRYSLSTDMEGKIRELIR